MKNIFIFLVGLLVSVGALSKTTYEYKPGSGISIGNPYYAVIKKDGNGKWVIKSFNENRLISDVGDEILTANYIGDDLVITPHFDTETERYVYKDFKNQPVPATCKGNVPRVSVGVKEINRSKYTNVCDSAFMTNSDPAVNKAAQTVASVLGAVVTFGGTVAVSSVAGEPRYLNVKELHKAVQDTRFDEMVARISSFTNEINVRLDKFERSIRVKNIPVKVNVLNGVGDIVAKLPDSILRWGYGAGGSQFSGLNSPFPIDFGFSLNGERRLIEDFVKKYPQSHEEIDAWVAKTDALMKEYFSAPYKINFKCKDAILKPIDAGSFGYHAIVTLCPGVVASSGESFDVGFKVTGISGRIVPQIMMEDANMRVKLDVSGLSFENKTSEFLDVKDISVNVNGLSYTLPVSNGNPHVTLPPNSTYPRQGGGGFTPEVIMDSAMRRDLQFSNVDAPTAKKTKVDYSVAIRYSVENSTVLKTLRKANSVTLADEIKRRINE